ncbi:MAG: Amidohydrolase [Promethearchaeota archaeon]|nr:MAG: Amidohydrolase [Candidatus Lokiarchaeota archaeon]
MLTATISHNGNTRKENMIVIDGHSHLGQDEDGATMMNPLAPGQGTFDFWSKVQGKIEAHWEKTGEKSFFTTLDGSHVKITLDFEPFPFTDKIFKSLSSLGKRHSDLSEKIKYNSFIDMAAVFPFQDIFRDKRPEALYRASNLNIARFTTRFPFSTKLIGYCRVDPLEGEKAVNEVKYSREVLGLRGLKLHPRSEGWVDHARTEKPIPILVEAVKHSMPIIFDTRGKKTIMDLGVLIKKTRNYLKQNHPELLPNFKAIIAHFAQGNVQDYEVYNTVVQPNTYGDLSMLHGEGAANFLKDFRTWFKKNNKKNVDGRDWSEYLLYATDYPYFGEVHAEKLLIHLFSKDFFDQGGTLKDTKNILGLNQLRILPEYSLPLKSSKANNTSSFLVTKNPGKEQQTPSQIITTSIAQLLSENRVDIKKILLQFKNNWYNLDENIILEVSKPNQSEKNELLVMNVVKDYISYITPLSSKLEWKKFGYEYFNPDERAFFASSFKGSQVKNDPVQLKTALQQIL